MWLMTIAAIKYCPAEVVDVLDKFFSEGTFRETGSGYSSSTDDRSVIVTAL